MTRPQGKLRVEILGLPDSGRSTLAQGLVSYGPTIGPAIEAVLCDRATPAADAVILTLPQTSDGSPEQQLASLLQKLDPLTCHLGRQLAPGSFPVFVVLTKSDLLAGLDDSLDDWLKKVTSRQQALTQVCHNLLGTGKRRGFGAPRLHIRATAHRWPCLRGMPLKPKEPFGFRELATKVREEVLRYQGQHQVQDRRLRLLVTATLILLALPLALAAVWLVRRDLRNPIAAPVFQERWEAGEWLVRGRDLVQEARRLLTFEGYWEPRSPKDNPDGEHLVPAIHWKKWHRAAVALNRELAEAEEHLRQEQIGQTLVEELRARKNDLETILIRIGILGIVDGGYEPYPPLGIPADLPGLPSLQQESHRRMAMLDASMVTSLKRPLPNIVPKAVSDSLAHAARVNLEKLLDPVRRDLRSLVLSTGGGRETPEAWREVADGWLTHQADFSLQEWRQLVLLLAVMAGEPEPGDPVSELQLFLRQPEFHLPLGYVILKLPAELQVPSETLRGVKPTDGPLTIVIHRDGEPALFAPFVVAQNPAPVLAGAEEFVYTPASGQSPRTWRFRSGDLVNARVQIVDETGKRWELFWPASDSPSHLYTFAVLSQPPRIRPAHLPVAEHHPILYSVRLRFPDSSAYSLPRLFPR
jgi:hypothetical protein